tara:strand:- start:1156 stop:1671 length:516 start_codon:yes stop_codon:yes gene_type:complete
MAATPRLELYVTWAVDPDSLYDAWCDILANGTRPDFVMPDPAMPDSWATLAKALTIDFAVYAEEMAGSDVSMIDADSLVEYGIHAKASALVASAPMTAAKLVEYAAAAGVTVDAGEVQRALETGEWETGDPVTQAAAFLHRVSVLAAKAFAEKKAVVWAYRDVPQVTYQLG